MKFISHRGESIDAPENTMSAFKLAKQRQTAGIETDIHLTLDGQIVCIHDSDTARVANKSMIIENNSYEDLQKLLYNNNMPNFTNEKLPLLKDLLELLEPEKIFFIEIKTQNLDILKKMAELIEELKIPCEQIYIISFYKEIIIESKKYMPHIKTQWLTSFEEINGVTTPTIGETIEFLKKANADGIDAHCKKLFNKEYIDALKAENFSVNVWTVDDIETAKYFANLNVDYITSNCAAKLNNLFCIQ